MGFDPSLWFKFEEIENKSDLEQKLDKTAQIVEAAVESITTNLRKLIQQRKIYGKIETNQDKLGYYFVKGRDEKETQNVFKDRLLEIETFLKEFSSIVFYIPPTVIGRIDEIIAEAKRYNFDLLVKKAEDLKNDFFIEKKNLI